MASTGDVTTRTPTIPRILPPKPLDPASAPKDFICAVCYELPISASDALVTPCCQHVFCAGCIKVSLQTKRECPFDRKKLRSRELNRLDGLSRRVFESIPVTCPIEGCNWKGCVGNYYRHAEECSVSDVCKLELARMVRKVQADLNEKARLFEKTKKVLEETVDQLEEETRQMDEFLASNREERRRQRQFENHYQQVEQMWEFEEKTLREEIARLREENNDLRTLLYGPDHQDRSNQERRRRKRDREEERGRSEHESNGKRDPFTFDE